MGSGSITLQVSPVFALETEIGYERLKAKYAFVKDRLSKAATNHATRVSTLQEKIKDLKRSVKEFKRANKDLQKTCVTLPQERDH